MKCPDEKPKVERDVGELVEWLREIDGTKDISSILNAFRDAADTIEALSRKLEYASDDLAFLDRVRKENVELREKLAESEARGSQISATQCLHLDHFACDEHGHSYCRWKQRAETSEKRVKELEIELIGERHGGTG